MARKPQTGNGRSVKLNVIQPTLMEEAWSRQAGLNVAFNHCDSCPDLGHEIVDWGVEPGKRRCPFYKHDPEGRCYFQIIRKDIGHPVTPQDWSRLLVEIFHSAWQNLQARLDMALACGRDTSRLLRDQQKMGPMGLAIWASLEKVAAMAKPAEPKQVTAEDALEVLCQSLAEDPSLWERLQDMMADRRLSAPRIAGHDALPDGEAGSVAADRPGEGGGNG